MSEKAVEASAGRKIDWENVGPFDARKNKIALGLFSLLLLTYVLNAMDRQVFSVVATDVRNSIGADIKQIGLASTIFTLGMGVAGLPTGYLMSRLQRKWVTVVGIFLFSAATLLTAFSNGLTDLLVYRFFSGIGESMQLTSILAIGTSYFYRHRAVASSSLNFAFGIGSIIGPNLGAWLSASHGWKSPFLTFGIAGIPAFILVIFVARSWFSEYRHDETLVEGGEDIGAVSIFERGPFLMSLATILGGLAIYGYLGLYATYTREVLGFSTKQAGFAISCYGFGALLSLIGGWLGDRYDFRKVLLVAFVISAASGILLFCGISSVGLHYLLSLIFGASISGVGYANLSGGIIKAFKRSKSAIGSGLFTTSLYVPAAFAGLLIGWLAEMFGSWLVAGAIQLGVFSILSGVLAMLSGKHKAA